MIVKSKWPILSGSCYQNVGGTSPEKYIFFCKSSQEGNVWDVSVFATLRGTGHSGGRAWGGVSLKDMSIVTLDKGQGKKSKLCLCLTQACHRSVRAFHWH